MDFFQEQTFTFVSHTASIHLCAIRYLVLVGSMLDQKGASVGMLREFAKFFNTTMADLPRRDQRLIEVDGWKS